MITKKIYLKLTDFISWKIFFISLLSSIIILIVIKAPVDMTGSDARGTLLTSQAIIEKHTIKLNDYKNVKKYTGWQIKEKNNHLYYYFPLGSVISSIPAVWVAIKVFDQNMILLKDDTRLQKLLSSFIAAIIFILLYQIARLYLKSTPSIVIAFLFWGGTSLSSTLGTALWSQDFATLYSLFSIFFLLKIVKLNKIIYWIPLSISLFMAYLTRPTLSLFVIFAILFLFLNNKKYISIIVAIIVGIFLLLFLIFSIHEYNQFLPDYYMPKRLSSGTFFIALWGNLASPARGIFIYSPFLLLFFIAIKDTVKIFKKHISLIIIALWIIVHLIIVSNFPHWWGGGSYGARLMEDVLPGFYLLFIILLRHIYQYNSYPKKIFITLFLIITFSVSFFVNTAQGLYNRYSAEKWNYYPSIDKYPEYIFDWQYPQFLHTEKRHKARLKEYSLKKNEFRNLITKTFDVAKLPHRTGKVSSDGIIAKKVIDVPGHITFGPYIFLPKGLYKMCIGYISSKQKSVVVGKWDITIGTKKTILEGELNGTDMQEMFIVKEFEINKGDEGKVVEIRNYYNGKGNLTIKYLEVTRLK